MNSLHLDPDASAKFLSRRGFLAGTGGAFALLALAGCRSAVGGDQGGNASTEDMGESNDGGAAAANLVLATPAAPDPAGILHRQADTGGCINLVFDRLVDLDPDTMAPVAWLATDRQWNEDRSALALTLRDDGTWHSGRAFGPEDVIFSINAAQEPEARSQVADILGPIGSMEATGDFEVTLTFAEPTSNVFDALAFNPIVDSETYADAAQGNNVVGTGPFTWESFIPGQELVVIAN